MQLYVAHISPYARLTRIVVAEKGLADRVQLVFRPTRMPENPLYAINPSGRIPCLLLDDGTVFEDSALICAYLDALDGVPAFARPAGEAGWSQWRREATARSLMDGLSVWLRELRRPQDEQSSGIVGHERARALRTTRALEVDLDDPVWQGPFNMAQMTLIVALQMEMRLAGFTWREESRGRLAAWADRLAGRPSIQQTSALE